MVVNEETHNWSKHREKVSMECSVINGTYMLHNTPQDSRFISEDRVQRVWGPEVREYRAKIVSSAQDRCAPELAAAELPAQD